MRSADRLRSLHSSPSALTKQLPQLGRTTHSRSAAAVAPLSSMGAAASNGRPANPPLRPDSTPHLATRFDPDTEPNPYA